VSKIEPKKQSAITNGKQRNPEDASNKFLRNVVGLPPKFMALQHRSYYFITLSLVKHKALLINTSNIYF
jgi:hypothetical protein